MVYVPLVRAARWRRVRPDGGAALSLVGPFCGFLLAMVLLYSRAAVPFLYFQF